MIQRFLCTWPKSTIPRHACIVFGMPSQPFCAIAWGNEGAFNCCFEMGDEDEVKRIILRRGLRNRKLRSALERSHLVSLTHWLAHYPDLAEAYCADEFKT